MEATKVAIPVFRPFSNTEEEEAVIEVLRSGWWGQGPVTEAFEREFAAFVGSKHAIALNSATAALHLSLLVAGVEGGEVITPSLTFVSTNHAILYNRATPVFADIDPVTLCIDPEDVERKITPRTKAIIAVDYAGYPARLAVLLDLAAQHDLIFIEDAAHAAGASYFGKPVGSFAHMTCFSFHPVKNLATGDGGMITTGNDEWAARLKRLRWLGINKDTWARQGKDAHQYAWAYDVDEVGFKCHSNDLMSAIARVQLKRLPETNARRLEIAGLYDAGLRDLEWLQLPRNVGWSQSAIHAYVVRCQNRDGLSAWLKQHGIATGMHYIPNHLHKVFAPYRTPLPVTEREWTRLLTLPCFPALRDNEVEYIVDVIRKFKG